MIAQAKKVIKKILRFLHNNIQTPVKGIYREKAESFFEKANQTKINYVVLRWYENLPFVEPGEDFDILVANEDCKRLNSLLRIGNIQNKSFIKCDVYPVNNTKGFIAYYPPFLAQRCLENRTLDKSGVWILEPRTYFFALAYHAVFHKGYSSGLKTKYKSAVATDLEHDYDSVLRKLALQASIECTDYTLEGLESLLKENDWVPPMDIYFRRSQKNPWLYDRLLDCIPDTWLNRKGLVCFILRELGNTEKWHRHVCELIEEADATIIKEVSLSDTEKDIFGKYTRGGDWGKGPFKQSGGRPARVIIAKKQETGKDTLPHGVVEYEWVKIIKERVREDYNKSVPYVKNSNILHSTDNGVEASYYISILEKATGNSYEEYI